MKLIVKDLILLKIDLLSLIQSLCWEIIFLIDGHSITKDQHQAIWQSICPTKLQARARAYRLIRQNYRDLYDFDLIEIYPT